MHEPLFMCVSITKTVLDQLNWLCFSPVVWTLYYEKNNGENHFVSCQVFHSNFWKLILPSAVRSEMRIKALHFDKWHFFFPLKPPHFHDVLTEISPYVQSSLGNDIVSEGGSWSQLFSKWLVNQRQKGDVYLQTGAKPRKKEQIDFMYTSCMPSQPRII